MRKSVIVLLLFFSVFAWGQKKNKELQIVERNMQYLSADITQLIIVFTQTTNQNRAKLIAMQKGQNGWEQVLKPIGAGIGRNGFAAPGEKREGDGKSPSGVFKLGQLFTYENNVVTQMPFTQTTSEDKWIDDPESPDYNQHVRGKTNAKSYENLLLKNDYYKYCMVIEYNTNPVEKGKGSAIFFHLNMKPYESTSGCIAIAEKDMKKVLEWLNPEENPHIIMGKRKAVYKGFKK
jgi:L,D-peptidoglycan transpeptidase YkuD (ErfK/YbiS/YcfS/YnhG family)